MSEQKPPQKEIILGDDGELHQILDDPASQRDAIFCVHCATPNLPYAKFCNECGRSLIEQQVGSAISDDTEWTKEKNYQAARSTQPTYDPNRYTVRKKLPAWKYVIGFILVVVFSIASRFREELAEIVRVVSIHPAEIMLALILVILAAIVLWFSSIKD